MSDIRDVKMSDAKSSQKVLVPTAANRDFKSNITKFLQGPITLTHHISPMYNKYIISKKIIYYLEFGATHLPSAPHVHPLGHPPEELVHLGKHNPVGGLPINRQTFPSTAQFASLVHRTIEGCGLFLLC
jgi:hypothetical protein